MKKPLIYLIFLISLSLSAFALDIPTSESVVSKEVYVFSFIEPSTLESRDLPELKAVTLEVNISNLRNKKGVVRINIFNSDEGFPTEPAKAKKAVMIPVKDKKFTVIFTGVPSGEYAISAIHDERPSEKLMTSWLDIPAEGYGSSAKRTGFFERPTFWGSEFDVGIKDMKINIKIGY